MQDARQPHARQPPDVATGARNLLLDCAGLTGNCDILIVGEDNTDPFFDPELCRILADEARALGFRAQVRLVDATLPGIPPAITAAMHAVSATFFFSRLGGRARFAVPDVPGVIVNCYTMTPGHLADPFATVAYSAQRQVHDALVAQIGSARRYRITAPCGTDLTGHIPARRSDALARFALETFPMMIFPPVMCPDLAGRLVVDHFVTSTGTRLYDDDIVLLDEPLTAWLEAGRITRLEGPREAVERVLAQMKRAAALTGGDPMRVNSWHTGINPNTFTDTDARSDPDRWGAISLGAPRYTHFHAAGHDPGDVALSLLDATIDFDDVPFWQDGRFVFLDRPEIKALIPQDSHDSWSSAIRRNIGI